MGHRINWPVKRASKLGGHLDGTHSPKPTEVERKGGTFLKVTSFETATIVTMIP